jgi:lipopolysaccharide assembly outer membrane protein LptD (OstA)
MISYYLKNRFTALYLDNTNSLAEQEMGYIMLGQSFNFSDPESPIYYKGDPDKDFSDIFGEIRLNLLNGLYFKTKATYDPYNNGLSYYNALVRWKISPNESLGFEYVYRENSFETIDLKGKLKVFKPLSIFFDARYDLRENDDLDTLFGIDLELGCWGTRVWIENSSGSSGRKSETSVRFSIYLIGLNVNTQQANKY